MEDITTIEDEKEIRRMNRRYRLGRILMGIIIVGIGKVFLLSRLGVEMPKWLLTDGALIAGIALAWGARKLFRPGGWMILMLIGLADLAETLNPALDIWEILWPSLLIMVGLAIMFKPRWHNHKHDHWHRCKNRHGYSDKYKYSYSYQDGKREYRSDNPQVDSGDIVESTSIFGGVKRNIISKDFKGGEIVCVFGGADINLMQAEIVDKAELELTMVFGGAKLLIPAHWEVKHEMTAILGGIDDKRPIVPASDKQSTSKVLILKGTVIFGGVDINSY